MIKKTTANKKFLENLVREAFFLNEERSTSVTRGRDWLAGKLWDIFGTAHPDAQNNALTRALAQRAMNDGENFEAMAKGRKQAVNWFANLMYDGYGPTNSKFLHGAYDVFDWTEDSLVNAPQHAKETVLISIKSVFNVYDYLSEKLVTGDNDILQGIMNISSSDMSSSYWNRVDSHELKIIKVFFAMFPFQDIDKVCQSGNIAGCLNEFDMSTGTVFEDPNSYDIHPGILDALDDDDLYNVYIGNILGFGSGGRKKGLRGALDRLTGQDDEETLYYYTQRAYFNTFKAFRDTLHKKYTARKGSKTLGEKANLTSLSDIVDEYVLVDDETAERVASYAAQKKLPMKLFLVFCLRATGLIYRAKWNKQKNGEWSVGGLDTTNDILEGLENYLHAHGSLIFRKKEEKKIDIDSDFGISDTQITSLKPEQESVLLKRMKNGLERESKNIPKYTKKAQDLLRKINPDTVKDEDIKKFIETIVPDGSDDTLKRLKKIRPPESAHRGGAKTLINVKGLPAIKVDEDSYDAMWKLRLSLASKPLFKEKVDEETERLIQQLRDEAARKAAEPDWKDTPHYVFDPKDFFSEYKKKMFDIFTSSLSDKGDDTSIIAKPTSWKKNYLAFIISCKIGMNNSFMNIEDALHCLFDSEQGLYKNLNRGMIKEFMAMMVLGTAEYKMLAAVIDGTSQALTGLTFKEKVSGVVDDNEENRRRKKYNKKQQRLDKDRLPGDARKGVRQKMVGDITDRAKSAKNPVATAITATIVAFQLSFFIFDPANKMDRKEIQDRFRRIEYLSKRYARRHRRRIQREGGDYWQFTDKEMKSINENILAIFKEMDTEARENHRWNMDYENFMDIDSERCEVFQSRLESYKNINQTYIQFKASAQRLLSGDPSNTEGGVPNSGETLAGSLVINSVNYDNWIYDLDTIEGQMLEMHKKIAKVEAETAGSVLPGLTTDEAPPLTKMKTRSQRDDEETIRQRTSDDVPGKVLDYYQKESKQVNKNILNFISEETKQEPPLPQIMFHNIISVIAFGGTDSWQESQTYVRKKFKKWKESTLLEKINLLERNYNTAQEPLGVNKQTYELIKLILTSTNQGGLGFTPRSLISGYYTKRYNQLSKKIKQLNSDHLTAESLSNNWSYHIGRNIKEEELDVRSANNKSLYYSSIPSKGIIFPKKVAGESLNITFSSNRQVNSLMQVASSSQAPGTIHLSFGAIPELRRDKANIAGDKIVNAVKTWNQFSQAINTGDGYFNELTVSDYNKNNFTFVFTAGDDRIIDLLFPNVQTTETDLESAWIRDGTTFGKISFFKSLEVFADLNKSANKLTEVAAAQRQILKDLQISKSFWDNWKGKKSYNIIEGQEIINFLQDYFEVVKVAETILNSLTTSDLLSKLEALSDTDFNTLKNITGVSDQPVSQFGKAFDILKKNKKTSLLCLEDDLTGDVAGVKPFYQDDRLFPGPKNTAGQNCAVRVIKWSGSSEQYFKVLGITEKQKGEETNVNISKMIDIIKDINFVSQAERLLDEYSISRKFLESANKINN